MAAPTGSGTIDAGEMTHAMQDVATVLPDHPVHELRLDLAGHAIRIRTAGHPA